MVASIVIAEVATGSGKDMETQVSVHSLDEWERLCDHQGSVSGVWDPARQRGTATFPRHSVAMAALREMA